MSYYFRHIIKILCVWFVAIMASHTIVGQAPLLKVLNKQNGLPSNHVYRVLEDPDGYIWICTDAGVCKYDGQKMTCFDQTDGLPDKDIYKITLDDLGRLWLLHVSNKIAFIQNDSVHVFPTLSAPFTQRQNFNTGANQGIKIGPDQYFINGDNQLTNSPLYRPTSQSNGLIWNDYYWSNPVDGGTLKVTNLIDTTNKYFTEVNVDVQVISQYHEPTQTFQIYTGNKLYIYDTLFVRQQIIDVKISSKTSIFSALRDGWGNLWICTRNGIFFQSYSQRMHRISLQDDAKGINIIKILESKSGPIILDDNGGVYSLVNDRLQLINAKRIHSGLIYDAEIKGDFLYISSGLTGLIRLNISSSYKSDFETIMEGTKSFIMADQRRVFSGGYFFREIDILTKSKIAISKNFYKKLSYNHKSKTVWINSNDSLYIYDDAKEVTLQKAIGFPRIEHIKYIGKGKTIVTTVEGKNYICNDSDCVDLNQLKDVHIVSINIIDDVVWLNTDHKILKSDFQMSDDDEYTFETYFDYGSLQRNVVVNDISIFKDHILLGTDDGLIKVDELHVPKSESKIPISIDYINQLEVDTSNNILDYKDRNITIDYNAKYFTNRNQLRYKYFLQGVDEDTVITVDQQARYIDLPSGNFVFWVKAVDDFDNSSEYSKINITIRKPWFHRSIVYIFGFLFLVGLGYWIFRSYLVRVNRKNQLQQQFAELELSALQSQMNPHFVFNAMNSIQNLITSDRPEEADLYVTRLASLMRKYLDSSKEKYIRLDEELEIIKVYLQLEQLRFGDKITYHIDNKLDSQYIKKRIPATIVQPFVENSLKHGLFHKVDNGNLYLRLYNDENNIYIEVEDDGIGRRAVKEIQDKSDRKHKSTGTKSIENKLDVLRKLDKIDIECTTVDLFDNKLPSGTKVIIRIRNK